MTHLKFLFTAGILTVSVFAQKRPDVPPQTIVAEVEGRQFTAGEFNDFLTAMGPQAQMFFDRDPKEFTRQLSLMLKLAKMGEAEHLDQKAPVKQQLEYSRANILMQSMMNQKFNGGQIQEADLQKAYVDHKDQFAQTYAKMIRISFGVDGKPRTEAEAKTKADDLQKQLTAGADFAKLAAENSDDGATKAKGGDLPPISRNSAGIPEPLKAAILQLKPGTVSPAVRESDAYYLFRLEKTEVRPLNEVRQEAIAAAKQESFRSWIESVRGSVDVKFLDENYFKPATAAAPPQLPPGFPAPKPASPAPPKP